MSARTRRIFDPGFKLNVCRQISSGEKRPAQVCREHSISESLLLRWRHEFEERGDAAFLPKEVSPTEALEKRIAELERYCGELSLDNAILKKAAALMHRSRGTL
jgi:transposase